MIRNLIDQGFDFKNKIVPFKKSNLFHNLPGGSSGSSGSGDQLHVQEDTIFISGMDPSISEADIAQHFGSIGIIKVTPKSIYLNTAATNLILFRWTRERTNPESGFIVTR